MAHSSSVALIRTASTTVLHDYERVTSLGRMREALQPAPTALCLAELGHFPFPSTNTTPWQVEGVVRALQAAGLTDIAMRRSAHLSMQSGVNRDLSGYLPVFQSLGLSSNHKQDSFRGANAVLLPTLRTDTTATIGGALWCAARAAAPDLRLATTHWLVDTLAILWRRCAGLFVVMDGTTAGNGPTPEVRNVLLASADPVALDAVAARLLGFDPLRDVASVRLAHERGLGVGDPRWIEVVGDVELARERWHFGAGYGSLASRMRQRIGSSRRLDDFFNALARSYEDVYQWPFERRWIFESWLRGTEWGRLFARYQRLNVKV